MKQSSKRNLCQPKHSYIFCELKEDFVAPGGDLIEHGNNCGTSRDRSCKANRGDCTSGSVSSATSMQGTRSSEEDVCWRHRSVFTFLELESYMWRGSRKMKEREKKKPGGIGQL